MPLVVACEEIPNSPFYTVKTDNIYAAEIATNFLAGEKVSKTDFLTAFNTEYLNIFRILPV